MNIFFFSLTEAWPWSYGSWIYNCLCNQCRSIFLQW